MRWNCPHCGTNLAVADEKVGSGWSFSRCYKCAGYGLVRRSDVTLIKVDRAPEGEPVLLPEAHENATAMLSNTATRNLNRYTGGGASVTSANPTPSINVSGNGAKPVVRTAIARSAQAARPAAAQSLPASAPPTRSTSQNFGLPEPLPAVPEQGVGQRLAPMVIGLAGMLTIGSGIYLYIQGQALFEKARTQARESSAPPAPETLSTNASLDGAGTQPGAEVIIAPSVPTTLNVTSLAGSADPNTANEVVDEVRSRAMAPARQAPAAREVAPSAAIKVRAHTSMRK